jgi:hypothetical protein
MIGQQFGQMFYGSVLRHDFSVFDIPSQSAGVLWFEA